jgi:hypothetical protein
VQAHKLCLYLAEGYRDLRPGMGVQIGIVLAHELLYRVVFVAASSGDLRGPVGMAAQDITAARIFDLIDLIRKPRSLPDPMREEPFDLGFGQGRNVMEACLRQRSDLSTFDHAPIAHECDPFAPKALGHFADLRS